MLQFISAPNLGNKRDKFVALLNNKVGRGNWFWVYRFGDKLYSWHLALQLYEDAYWVFFKNNLTSLKKLVKEYGDVMVFDKTDLKSGLDYKKQLHRADHYEDIAIRRCLRRFGTWFQGEDILKISDSELSEKNIIFHLPFFDGKLVNFHKYLVAAIAIEMCDQQELSEKLIK
jgi:hypothetical protein